LSELLLSAPAMQLPLGRLGGAFEALAAAGVDELHFEIGDGVFAPCFGLDPAFVRVAKASCGLPCHAHLLVESPERHIEAFAAAGCDVITVHAEACGHAHRVLQQIRNAGSAPGIAVKATTPLTTLDYLLPEAARVLLLTRDLGDTDTAPLNAASERAKILGEIIRYHKYAAELEVKGGIDFRQAALFARLGVRRLVVDGAAIYPAPDADPAVTLAAFRGQAHAAEHLV